MPEDAPGTDSYGVGEDVVPPDHWRFLWDVRRFRQNPGDGGVVVPTVASERTSPRPLPAGLSVQELQQQDNNDELQAMLEDHYVEDPSGTFRFAYSSDFLRWALSGPNSNPEYLHIRIVDDTTKELVAFLSATPMTLQVTKSNNITGVCCDVDGQQQKYDAALVDFVCVTSEHRGKGVCRWMYSEAARRCERVGINVLFCSSGNRLITAVASPRFYHLMMDGPFWIECMFAAPPRFGQTIEELYPPLPPLPLASSHQSLRLLTCNDVAAARELFNAHVSDAKNQYILSTMFVSDAHFAHTFLPRPGVVTTFVRDGGTRPEDLISFYFIDTLVLGDCPAQGKYIRTAYLFYTVATTCSRRDLLLEAVYCLKERAAIDGAVHVINALPTMGVTGEDTLQPLGFGPGTGVLHYYLYNVPGVVSVKPCQVAVFPGV